MTLVMLSSPSRKLPPIQTTSNRQAIIQLVEYLGHPVVVNFANDSEHSPAIIKTGGSWETEEFIIKWLEEAVVETISEEVLTLPDPRLVDMINEEGTGIRSVFLEGTYQWVVQNRHKVIYSANIATQEQLGDVMTLLTKETDLLVTFIQLLKGLTYDFPSAELTGESVVAQDLPNLTEPLSKSVVWERMSKLLGSENTPVDTQEAPDNPGTFLLQMEGAPTPIQILVNGDGDRLKDIGYLHQLSMKYPNEVVWTPNYQCGISIIQISRKLGKRYIEVLRSVLIDCNLVQEYTITSVEYVPSRTVLPHYTLL